MVSDEDIIKALDSRDRRTQPVWTSKDFQEHFGVEQPTVNRWLTSGRGSKPGLVAQGKIRERKSGSTRYYTMPEDTVIRGIPTASSSNIGVTLHKYEDFRKTCTKWRSITFGFTLIYLLIRLTAGKDLIDEFSVWGFIIVCTLLIAEGYVSQLFRGYHDPPEDIYHSLKVAINMFSITSGVATVGMIYIILTYFEWASGTAVVTAVAVVVFEAFSVAGAGVSAKVHFEMASKVIK
jgi:hypothetical protein